MVQLLFGLSTDNSTPGVIWDAIRSILSVFDNVVYTCIGFLYNILFNITETSILKSDVIKDFYGRVQLILGVIMIFKISVSLMQYVINPDTFNDKKTGFSQVITRIIVMLAMLTAIMPLNIPNTDTNDNSYNSYLNQHGLLFGTMYSLQHRILDQNTIAKLIIGNNSNSFDVTNDENETKQVEFSANSSVGNEIATYILKTFITINVKEEITNEEEAGNIDNYVCSPTDNISSKSKVKTVVTTSFECIPANLILPGAGQLVCMGVKSLNTSNNPDSIGYYYNSWIQATKPSEVTNLVNIATDDNYAFAYFPLVSTICGILLLLVFAVTCLDVAIRTLKLAVLRLIAPIAIISYIDPKASEKGAFSNWVKMLISTYIDLFIRLSIIYFIIFITVQIIHGGLDLPIFNGIIGKLSVVIIIIGLFYFAKQAPKFVMDALGIKSLGMGVGLSGLLGAAGALVGGGGLSGAASGFMNASTQAADAAAQGKQAPPAYSSQRDRIAQMLTGDKDAHGGLLGNATKAMQDRANANLAERVFGINRNKVAAAKDLKYALAADAAEAKNKYERFANGNMTDLEKNALINDYARQEAMSQDGWNDLSEAEQNDRINSYVNGLSALSADQQNNILSSYLEDDWASKETASAKQNAWYEEGAKMLESMNINETLQEKYSARGRRRARRVYDQNLAAQGTDRNYKINHSVRPKTNIRRDQDIRR